MNSTRVATGHFFPSAFGHLRRYIANVRTSNFPSAFTESHQGIMSCAVAAFWMFCMACRSSLQCAEPLGKSQIGLSVRHPLQCLKPALTFVGRPSFPDFRGNAAVGGGAVVAVLQEAKLRRLWTSSSTSSIRSSSQSISSSDIVPERLNNTLLH